MMYRVEQDWYHLLQRIKAGDDAEQARQHLLDSLTSLEPVLLINLIFSVMSFLY